MSEISEQKIHNLLSGWCKTACFFDDQEEVLNLGWEVLIHPWYSPDIAPSDFYLFQSLQNSLNEKNFSSIFSKDKKFWEDGIMQLPKKWQRVVEQNGKYMYNKVGENVFYFYFKTKGTFWPTQCVVLISSIQILLREVF